MFQESHTVPGIAHALFCIGCSYGYGTRSELSNADHIINDIRELLSIFTGYISNNGHN